MRTFYMLAIFGLLSSCIKENEVNLDTYNSNPWDADYVGAFDYFTIDSIVTVSTQGVLFHHHFFGHVDPNGLMPDPLSEGVIKWLDPIDGSANFEFVAQDGAFNFERFQVTLGQEYCYKISFHSDFHEYQEKELCDTPTL